ncbi:DUF3747 domain-containing protein [filamentous cyanobacterium LEGE 11480]|uniref:DUF3747 domain-containing protein n=1 Tax=Romeriopsis navalis LEGE 11480 TaxID=2777977 RepID=A0A928Z6Z4_9CYAN|nr:DUF3747 domain-containing protein [Romeriopsis navalis]MBE9033168.1 DUF3747 domain-containing protein [Romeriopsis navalis LEGE 11480]
MIKFPFLTPLIGFVSLLAMQPAQANVFSEIAVPQDRIIAVAAPYNEDLHQLLVIQQVEDDRPCWRASNNASGPVEVDPLLVDFDFTGICGRGTDSNGYSIRLGGRDLGWRYGLQVVKKDGDLRLLGVPTGHKNKPTLDIGSVGGWNAGFVKIRLNPGWRMAQRTYLGEPLGHIYFTNDQPLTAFSQPDLNQPTSMNAGINRSNSLIRKPYGVVTDRSKFIVPTE